MAILFLEGFDDFRTNADIAMTAAQVGAQAVCVAGRGGQGEGVQTNPAATVAVSPGSTIAWKWPASGTIIAGFAFQTIGTIFQNHTQGYISFFAGAQLLFSISQETNTGLYFYDSTMNPNIGTHAPGIGTAAFRNWQSYIEVELTPLTGSVIVRIDGATVLNLTGQNLGPAASLCDSMQMAVYNFGANVVFCSLDDLYVIDTTGAQNNAFLGNTVISSVSPIGDGAELQWTPLSGTSHFAMVNETPLDYAASYNSAPTAPLTDIYTFAAPVTTAGTLRALQLRSYAQTSAGGSDALAGVARIGGADFAGTAQGIPATWSGVSTVFELNPATGTAWTFAAIAAANGFGPKRTA